MKTVLIFIGLGGAGLLGWWLWKKYKTPSSPTATLAPTAQAPTNAAAPTASLTLGGDSRNLGAMLGLTPGQGLAGIPAGVAASSAPAISGGGGIDGSAFSGAPPTAPVARSTASIGGSVLASIPSLTSSIVSRNR